MVYTIAIQSPQPSPICSSFHRQSTLDGPHVIALLDATGRNLLEQQTTEQQPVVNTSDLSPGIYLLRMDNGPGIRWVKE